MILPDADGEERRGEEGEKTTPPMSLAAVSC